MIAHRGSPRTHPENSLPGFRRALETGVDGIELDVHLTVDGAVVVHHDPALRATPGSAASKGLRIADLTREELLRYPLAPGVPIPTLAEVLELVAGRATVYVEVKATAAVAAVMACIAASQTSCAIHGFDHRVALQVAHAQGAGGGTLGAGAGHSIPTGILSASYLIDPAGALRAARARDYWQQWEMIDEELVARIHAAGGRVVAWTVNDPADARRLAAMGVDGICSDELRIRDLEHAVRG